MTGPLAPTWGAQRPGHGKRANRPRAALPVLALLALAGLASPAAADGEVGVRFQTPAQAEGDLHAQGQWVILLFRAGEGSFEVNLAEGGKATNHTATKWHAPGADFYAPGTPDSEMDLASPVRGRLDVEPGSWASLYVEADRFELAATSVHGEMGVAEQGQVAGGFLPRGLREDGDYRDAHVVADDGVGLSLQGLARPGFAFALEAHGIRRLEWHNVTLACGGQGGTCPGNPSSEAGAAGAVSVEVLTYTELEVPGGSLSGAGEALTAAFGGPMLGLSVAGRLRMPEAGVDGECLGIPCPDPAGRTFLASGNLTLSSLSPAPGGSGRLQGRLDGAFAARFDESAVAGFSPAQGAAVGVAAVALALLVKSLLALFARKERPPALQHPKRQALHELIRSEPGLSFRELRRRLQWPNGTLVNHLARLEDSRLVVRRPFRNTVRFFENHGRYGSGWDEVVLLRDPGLRALHAWLQAHPASSQGEVLRHAHGQWGWRRSTTQDRLRALVEGRLVEKAVQGRMAFYTAKVPQAVPAAAAPPVASAA